METEFWLQKWASKDIGFHQGQANPLLVKHLKVLGLQPGERVFLPLCGKTLDIAWLLASGYRVVGAELSEMAIQELFQELGMTPRVVTSEKWKHYLGDNIEIFVGDLFDLSAADLGMVNAVYDRAALVAMPESMRGRYTSHLMQISQRAPQLLISFEYDQNAMAGPPFSVTGNEVKQHYGRGFQDLYMLANEPVAGDLKGICAAQEQVWLLRE